MDTSPVEARTTRSRAVAADLEEIFREAPPPAGEAPAARVRRFALVQPMKTRRAVSYGAMAAAAFLGVAGGALISRTLEPAKAAAPARAPVLPVEVAAVTPPAPAATLVPTLGATPPPQVLARPALSPQPGAASRVTRAKAERSAHDGGPCGRSCSRAEVMAADRNLRSAYARAVDAGVSRRTLVAYRDRWNGLRRYAVHQPRRMVSGYVLLANDLKRETRIARRRA